MNIRKKEKGFTIIEVVLVLAIAGLIFLMVFIALPALQRSQRDAQRKNDLSRLNTALASYSSNNRGALPDNASPATSWNGTAGFIGRYVTTAGDTFVDPSGNPYVLTNMSSTDPTSTIKDFDAASPNIYVTTEASCNGESLTLKQGPRKVAFQMKLEGSGVACVNN
jgi:prepilin-type N-terminal cleavage/methylation domain-containing protein